MREKRIKFGVIGKERRFLTKTKVMDTIVNTPLNPKTGRLMFDRAEIEERKKVYKGYHMIWTVLLRRSRGRGDELYMRLVIA